MILASQEISTKTGHEAGRGLLADMYQKHYGGKLPTILRTERGKPYFASGTPHFSITHTKRHVFCALSETPIGIDAEELDRDIDLRLAEKILSPGEMAQYLAAQDKRIALLTFWVLKEAVAKCTGEGLHGYPKDTDFSLEDPRVTQQDGCVLAVIEGEAFGLQVLTVQYIGLYRCRR